MKVVWLIAVVFSLSACVSSRNSVQVNLVNAELVRIDTLYRYKTPIKLLTWRSSDHIEYHSYASIAEAYRIGSKIPVLMRR